MACQCMLQAPMLLNIILRSLLQVVPGTNRCGRIDHDLVAGQTVANQEQVDMLLKRFPLVYAEAEPGSMFLS